MTSVHRTQALLSMMATEDSAGTKKDGRRDLNKASEQRTEMRAEMQERQERAEKLQADLADAADMNFGDKVAAFLFGSDNGASDIQEKMGENAAELEKVQHELELLKAQTKDEMSEIQEETGEVNQTYQALDEIVEKDKRIRQGSLA